MSSFPSVFFLHDEIVLYLIYFYFLSNFTLIVVITFALFKNPRNIYILQLRVQ
jgi:hypothetical protein